MLRDEAYVPFDIDFSAEDGEAKVITGPNMAGKSSCVRATVCFHPPPRMMLIIGTDSMYGSDWVVRTSRIGDSWDT